MTTEMTESAARDGDVVTVFDYGTLDAETRIVVQQHTREIRDRVKIVGDAMIAIGERLLEVKERLGHGHFGAWLSAEFEWSQDTAGNFMNVARLAQQNPKISEYASADLFGRSALALLAAPSTPAAAREELLERAAQGEPISHQAAKEVVQHHKLVQVSVQSSPVATPAAAPAVAPEPDASGPHVDAMRERFAAVGWLQFYRNDEGWRALSRTRSKQFRSWAHAEEFVSKLERAAADVAAEWLDVPMSHGPAQRVRIYQRTGNLVLHAGVHNAGDFVVSHTPTGYAIVRCPSLDKGLAAFEALSALDWSWKELPEAGFPDAYKQRLAEIRAKLVEDRIAAEPSGPPAPQEAADPTSAPPTAPALPALPDTLATTWLLVAPSQLTSFWTVLHRTLPLSTHGYVTPEEAISAAEELQRILDTIQAEGYTLSGGERTGTYIATNAAGVTIGPLRSVHAIRDAIQATCVAPVAAPPPAPSMAVVRPASPAATPASISTQARHQPIVPTVLLFDRRRHPYRLPELQRLQVTYGTSTTVRVAAPGGKLDFSGRQTLPQSHCYCIPDDAAWDLVTAAHSHMQQALDALAQELRQLGTYAKRLEEAGGMALARNPLSPTIISIADPDAYYAPSLIQWLSHVPAMDRQIVERHTAKMLVCVKGTFQQSRSQGGSFVCPVDDDWDRLQRVRAAVEEAWCDFEAVLKALGTYDVALRDGRYQQSAAAPSEQGAAPTPLPAPVRQLDWAALEHVAAEINQRCWERDEAGARNLALQLLQLLASPHELVLPPFPAQDRAALVAEIGVELEAEQLGPHLGGFLRAVGRYVAGVEPEPARSTPQHAPGGLQEAAERLADIQHRLERIEGWLDQGRHVCPSLEAVRGNVDNLERLADELGHVGQRAETTDLLRRVSTAHEMLQLLLPVIEEHGQLPLVMMTFVDDLLSTKDPFSIKAKVEAAGYDHHTVLAYAFAITPATPQYASRLDWLMEQLAFQKSGLAQRVAGQEAGA